MNKNSRIEHDSLGEIELPAAALYQAQTQRALNNFQISQRRMPFSFITALAQIKAAVAAANSELGELESTIAEAIRAEALHIAEGAHREHFVLDVFQTGSGTSTNMNMNEVLATLVSRKLKQTVHANDHINRGQSSNDVIPTAIQVAAAQSLHDHLLPALSHLIEVLNKKADQYQDVVKTGRTHIMDAVPLTLAQEMSAWETQLFDNHQRLQQSLQDLQQVPLGGTAIGTGLNAHPSLSAVACRHLEEITDIPFQPCVNKFARIASQDVAVACSGQLKVLAVTLMKISNDLRWMNSGPLTGLGEIQLPTLQPGSSIMPGKVNPVIPEAVAMVAAQIIGNDAAITVAGQSGNFQLNVMLPLIASNLLESLEIATSACRHLADKAIKDLNVNREHLEENLARNPMLATALNGVIGYEHAAKIAKRAYQEQRPVIDVAMGMCDLDESTLQELLNPEKLTVPKIPSNK